MSLLRCAVVALLFLLPANAQTILGFTPSSAAREAEIESKFKSIPSPDEERRQHRIFTQEPHVAGSKRNNQLAEYIRDEWKKQGLEDVIIRRYDVYGTNPKSASLEMIAPVHYQALLRESPIAADPDSKNPAISVHIKPLGSEAERSPISQKAMPRRSRLARVVMRNMIVAERNDAVTMPAKRSVPLSSCPWRRPRK